MKHHAKGLGKLVKVVLTAGLRGELLSVRAVLAALRPEHVLLGQRAAHRQLSRKNLRSIVTIVANYIKYSLPACPSRACGSTRTRP